MPMLLVGAILGASLASLLLSADILFQTQRGTLLLLSMGGLFAATVRAPLTASALIMEMTGSWENLPSLLCVSYCAVFCANRLKNDPVYESLKKRICSRTN